MFHTLSSSRLFGRDRSFHAAIATYGPSPDLTFLEIVGNNWDSFQHLIWKTRGHLAKSDSPYLKHKYARYRFPEVFLTPEVLRTTSGLFSQPESWVYGKDPDRPRTRAVLLSDNGVEGYAFNNVNYSPLYLGTLNPKTLNPFYIFETEVLVHPGCSTEELVTSYIKKINKWAEKRKVRFYGIDIDVVQAEQRFMFKELQDMGFGRVEQIFAFHIDSPLGQEERNSNVQVFPSIKCPLKVYYGKMVDFVKQLTFKDLNTILMSTYSIDHIHTQELVSFLQFLGPSIQFSDNPMFKYIMLALDENNAVIGVLYPDLEHLKDQIDQLSNDSDQPKEIFVKIKFLKVSPGVENRLRKEVAVSLINGLLGQFSSDYQISLQVCLSVFSPWVAMLDSNDVPHEMVHVFRFRGSGASTIDHLLTQERSVVFSANLSDYGEYEIYQGDVTT